MSELIYEAVRIADGSPLVEHDLAAYNEAIRVGDLIQAERVAKDALHTARQIQLGLVSGIHSDGLPMPLISDRLDDQRLH